MCVSGKTSTLDQKFSRKQKRPQGATSSPSNSRRTLLKKTAYVPRRPPYTFRQQASKDVSENKFNPISHWIQKGSWPEEYFEQTRQARETFEQESNINRSLTRKRSTSFLCGEQSDVSDVKPSNQKPREKKSALYVHPGYETLLATKGRYMNILDLGVTDARPIAELCLIQSNRSIKTHYFAKVCLKRLAKACIQKMKLWLFGTPLC